MAFLTAHELAFIFGLLGNIISFLVFLAPLPTFYTIWRKKTSAGFHSIPYVIALASAMLLLYYGFLKTDALLIITINSIGCVIEVIYLFLFIFYATKQQKIFTVKLILVFNVFAYGSMMILANTVLHGSKRVDLVGLVCAVYNVAVFAAPLSIMREVVRTKSVEFMPFSLSLFLTVCATMWFLYGLFVKDPYIALPNVLGFIFGIAQMVLYLMYKDNQTAPDLEHKQQALDLDIALGSMEESKPSVVENNSRST